MFTPLASESAIDFVTRSSWFTYLSIFSQFSSLTSRNSWIIAFHKHFGLILLFLGFQYIVKYTVMPSGKRRGGRRLKEERKKEPYLRMRCRDGRVYGRVYDRRFIVTLTLIHTNYYIYRLLRVGLNLNWMGLLYSKYSLSLANKNIVLLLKTRSLRQY